MTLPHCHPDWRLANRQSDALEYLVSLLADHRGSLQGTPWKRTYDADIPDSTGLSPLILTFPERTDATGLMLADSSLESARTYALTFFIHEWRSPHDSTAALLYTPPYIFVTLPRFTNAGGKQHWTLKGLQEDTQLPVWTHLGSKLFVKYRPISGLFHIGMRPGCPPTIQEQELLESGAYLLLLRRIS